MLHWRGKRPFRATHYYPAQLRERHGEAPLEGPHPGWMNQLYWGDNLQVMSHLLKRYRGQVKLVYIDPPFDSKADYKKKIELRGQTVTNDQTSFEEKQYTDIWSNDEYLQFIYERIILIRELLAEDGALFLHCDHHKNHHIRCILDEIFGQGNYFNEIIWQRSTSVGSSKAIAKRFPTLSDTIWMYVKNKDSFEFIKLYTPPSEEYKRRFNLEDENGKYYWNTLASYSQETYDRLEKEGKVEWSENAKFPRYKTYLHELKGSVIPNVWTDINMLNSMSIERRQSEYPTQKPEALLERIIQASTNPGDLVFDCFMGSGTTQAVAMRLGRRFLGADINLGAIQITTKRLLTLADELNKEPQQAQGRLDLEEGEAQPQLYTGFEVYNVNHYDVFRNPVQARDLLIQALEIQPLPGNALWDGEKDGQMVKLMPINRIATRADLTEILTNVDRRQLDRRRDEVPAGRPILHILLVCMGHEPSLAAYLKEALLAEGYLVAVAVVDILRDRTDLQFRRDAEAEVVIEGRKLVIRQFYPLNLLAKLSLEKQSVADWRELAESVMIDWNYDGVVFEPRLVDLPEKKNELVQGVYDLPPDAGHIRVKITDLLSESWEDVVEKE